MVRGYCHVLIDWMCCERTEFLSVLVITANYYRNCYIIQASSRFCSLLLLECAHATGRMLRSVSGIMRPQEEILLEPFNYYGKLPGKGIRPRMIAAFNQVRSVVL